MSTEWKYRHYFGYDAEGIARVNGQIRFQGTLSPEDEAAMFEEADWGIKHNNPDVVRVEDMGVHDYDLHGMR